MNGKARLVMIAAIVVVIGGVAMVMGEMRAAQVKPAVQADDPVLPSPGDIQRLLNKLEPDNPLHVDGKIGPATIAKWERVYIAVSVKKAEKGYYE